ncbi:DUF1853 family protein [Marinobacterium rhizophilum]|nr:DUF1853 family protein [Marinobacterium rhizophilum]
MRSAAPSFDALVPAFSASTCSLDVSAVSPAHRRLGLYYEDLIGTLLSGALPCDPLSVRRNVQCAQAGITAGEFDFLYRSTEQWFHLETAVKFYLCCGDGSALEHFVGPGRRDRLDIKWQRLQQHQLRLASHPVGRECLDRLGIRNVHSQLLMPGYLFYRAGAEVPGSTLHREISPRHQQGWWLPLRDLELLPASRDHRYAILSKLRWLAPARLADDQALDWHALREQLVARAGPALVVQLSCVPVSGSRNRWCETGRGFVVPDDWEPTVLESRIQSRRH